MCKHTNLYNVSHADGVRRLDTNVLETEENQHKKLVKTSHQVQSTYQECITKTLKKFLYAQKHLHHIETYYSAN